MNYSEFLLVHFGRLFFLAMQYVSKFLNMTVRNALELVFSRTLPIVGDLFEPVWDFCEFLGFNMDMTIIELLLGSALVLVLVYRLASFITGLFT